MNKEMSEKSNPLFDDRGRMPVLDGMRYYKKTSMQNNMFRVQIDMTEPVRGENLKEALEAALKRYRLFRMKVVHDGVRYYLQENDKQPMIYTLNASDQPEAARIENDFLFWIGYEGRRIWLDVFHGISDGKGTMKFLETFLGCYCQSLNPKPSSDALISEVETESPEEYTEAIRFVDDSQVNATSAYVWETAFQFPDAHMSEANACHVYELKLNEKDYESYVKNVKTSRAAGLCGLFNRAVAQVHEVKKAPIVAAMAVNAREAYGAETTMQCCVGTVPVWFDETIQKLCVEEQLEKTKEMVRQGLQKENILTGALRTKTFNTMLHERYATLAEKQTFCRKMAETGADKYTYGFSYVGDVEFRSETQAHVDEIKFMLCANTSPVILEVTKYKDVYHIIYCTHLENDPYVYKFHELMTSEGLRCTCEKQRDFIETQVCF